jgi:hypothetical protein
VLGNDDNVGISLGLSEGKEEIDGWLLNDGALLVDGDELWLGFEVMVGEEEIDG